MVEMHWDKNIPQNWSIIRSISILILRILNRDFMLIYYILMIQAYLSAVKPFQLKLRLINNKGLSIMLGLSWSFR